MEVFRNCGGRGRNGVLLPSTNDPIRSGARAGAHLYEKLGPSSKRCATPYDTLFVNFCRNEKNRTYQTCIILLRENDVVSWVISDQAVRGTQQTVSVNICSGDVLSSTIFGLKCGEKLEFSLAQTFVIWGK